jgi:hypothetical protein
VSDAPTWNDVEREEAGVQLTLPLSSAQSLRAVLPRLRQLLESRGARTPEARQRRRDTQLALATLAGALDESLRPQDPLEAPAGGG